jgi:hypothetical protein
MARADQPIEAPVVQRTMVPVAPVTQGQEAPATVALGGHHIQDQEGRCTEVRVDLLMTVLVAQPILVLVVPAMAGQVVPATQGRAEVAHLVRGFVAKFLYFKLRHAPAFTGLGSVRLTDILYQWE